VVRRRESGGDGRQEETHQLAAGHSKHPRVSQLHLCGTITQNLWQARRWVRHVLVSSRASVTHLQPQLSAVQRTAAIHTRFFLQRLWDDDGGPSQQQ
jgi:hypothetical protein